MCESCGREEPRYPFRQLQEHMLLNPPERDILGRPWRPRPNRVAAAHIRFSACAREALRTWTP